MHSLRSVRSSLLVSFACLGLAVVAGCTEEGPDRPRVDAGGPGTDSGTTTTACSAGGPSVICLGNQEIACNPDGSESGRRNCPDLGQVCSPELGCTVCIPGRSTCSGNDVQRCNADGTAYETIATCDPSTGATCNATVGACTNPCEEAAASNSYIGCEYWPVAVANGVYDEFEFAVVVSNPQSTDTTVTVTRGGSPVGSPVTIPPGEIRSITLPWVAALRSSDEGSGIVAGGAYRLQSTLPVTVYQFNPLEYELPRDCPASPNDSPGDGRCNSFSNDASLLLPTHVLTPNYLVTSFPTRMNQQSGLGSTQVGTTPGFFTVTAADPGETTVTITFGGDVLAGTSGPVTAFTQGSTGTFTLQQGDVLQVYSAAPATCTVGGSDQVDIFTRFEYCRVTAQHDLTGSEVRATQRVAVIAGHECAFIPYNRWACDHIEEQLFPEESWGRDAFVSITQPLRSEPNLIRIVSGRDGNMLTFDPPSAHAATTLNRGQVLEFEAINSFRVQGTEAIQVAQFLVGQDYAGIGTSGEGGQGDPSMSLAIPTDQFRTSYAFLAPTTYAQSYINVTAPMGATVTLDGNPVSGFGPVGTTGYGVARVPVSGGAHEIEGSMAFGIVVYGFGSYTSYMYPGGLDLEEINVPF